MAGASFLRASPPELVVALGGACDTLARVPHRCASSFKLVETRALALAGLEVWYTRRRASVNLFAGALFVRHPGNGTQTPCSTCGDPRIFERSPLAGSPPVRGVSVEQRPDGGILITPLPLTDSTNAAGKPQQGYGKKKGTTRDSSEPQPMDTYGSAQAVKLSKKQQRDAQRAKDDQALRASPSTARWKLLTQHLVHNARRTIRDSTHDAWKRSRTPEAQLEARRKWRALLWREWTRPRFVPPPMPALPAGCVRILTGVQVLGARSLRDEYFLSRARALSRAAGISVSYDIARWLRQPRLRQAPSNRTVCGCKQRRVKGRPGFQPPSLCAAAKRSHAAVLEDRRLNLANISIPLMRKRCACVHLSGRAEIQTDACARRSADLV